MLNFADLLVQPIAEGSHTTSPGTASLASGTTAGSTVLIVVVAAGAAVTTPSGFVSDSGAGANNARLNVFRKSNVGAGENNWSLSGSSVLTKWIAAELSGLDLAAPLDVEIPTTGTAAHSSGTSVSPGTTAQSTSYDVMELAFFASYRAANTTANAFSGYTGSFSEVYQGNANDGTKSVGLAVAAKATQQLETAAVTATAAVTLTATDPASSYLAVYSAEGAKREANIAHFWGFFPGVSSTPAGLGTGTAGFRYFETVAGSPAITADGLQLASSAAAESVATATIAFQASPALNSYVLQTRLRFDGSLPSVDTDLVATVGGSNQLVLRYVSASQQFGVKIGTGTEVLSDAAVAADTWYTVDLRIISASSAQTGDWQVDYGAGPVTQTQATLGAAATSGQVRLGWAGAITVPGVTFAQLLVSNVAGHYPLGVFTFALVGPDPAGTPTVLTTVGNFAFITNNATGAALTSGTLANVPAAIDDFPPTVGASADGFCVATASATDYLEQPMSTYDASGTGSIRTARLVMPVWAASATACTCKVQGYDGTTRTVLFAEANPTTDNSSTPGWICAMWRPSGGWTQAKLDAAAIDYGSADATPDNGPLAVGIEVAIQVGSTQPLFGAMAAQKLDPVSGGILAVDVTTSSGHAADLYYEESGSPTTVNVPPATTQTEIINAPDMPAVNYIAIYPEPE